MTHDPRKTRERAFALIGKLDPDYCHRWVIFDSIVKRLSGPDARWLDCGCGTNLAVEEFPCKLNVGIDLHCHPGLRRVPGVWFVQGEIERMPFSGEAFTLVTLNAVVEHLRDPGAAFREIHRVLEPGGRLLVHTTNLLSPLILAGKLLPPAVRRAVFTRVLGACGDDVFPVFHRANTPGALSRVEGFAVEELHAVQDLNHHNRAFFLFLLAWHLVTRLPGLWRLRTNLIVLLRKT
jgi:SAM-dependent methyltransferase